MIEPGYVAPKPAPQTGRELLADARTAYRAACEYGGVVFDLRDDDHLVQALNLLSAPACDALDRAVQLYGPEQVQA